jgi:hypothetical protein
MSSGGVAWGQDSHRLIADTILCGSPCFMPRPPFWESARHCENLVLSMITGRKRRLLDDGT